MNNKQKARKQLAYYYGPTYLFADTETTGLTKSSELVELAIVDHEGNTLMDTLIKPKGPIPQAASDVHGLTAEDLKDAPTWRDIHTDFLSVLGDRTLVFYNRTFDLRLIKQTAGIYGLSGVEFDDMMDSQTACAMKPYAVFNGELNKSGRGFRSVKLEVAAEQEGVSMADQTGIAHRALYDSLLVQRLCKKMAAGGDEVKVEEVLSF